MGWKFYFDESFHDGNITEKDGIVNICKAEVFDLYVGFFNGYKEEYMEEIWNQYAVFEQKYKKFYQLTEKQELKNGVIHSKNYNYGFGSMNIQAINLYDDYFDLFDNPNLVINFCMISKTELITTELLKNTTIQIKDYYNAEALNYSLTKFMFNYQNNELFRRIICIETADDLKKCMYTLKRSVELAKKNMSKAIRKKSEITALNELSILLNHAEVYKFDKLDFHWNYENAFEGFNKLLKEREIDSKQVDLFIDNHCKTADSAANLSTYEKVQNIESKKCIGVRISDFFCNFLGELGWALYRALKEDPINDLSDFESYNYYTKHILPEKWFDLDEKQFDLCFRVEKIILKYHNLEWVGYDGTYCDYPVMVFGYMEYIYSYETFEHFKQKTLAEHAELCNEYCCNKLNYIFKRAGTKAAAYVQRIY